MPGRLSTRRSLAAGGCAIALTLALAPCAFAQDRSIVVASTTSTQDSGLFDYLLNFNKATRPLLLIPVGLAYFGLYYVLFRLVIVKLDLKTPGREIESAVPRHLVEHVIEETNARRDA